MADTSARMLRLLSLLQARRHWSGPVLAERLGVSVRTLRRDMDRLRELGYPVDAERGVDGGYRLVAGASLPPLVLDDDEAVALVVGLHAAVESATVAGIAEPAVQALAKVVQVLPGRLRRRIDALGAMTEPTSCGTRGPGVDPGQLTTIAEACRNNERMAFSYTVRDGTQSRRHVDPHRLVLLDRRWYLVAWDLDRNDWRSFRLDRLAEPTCTGAHFGPRQLPPGGAGALIRTGIANLPARHRVEALVHAPAPAVRARLGRWARVEELDDERCLLQMASDTLDWPAMVLGAAAAPFEVRTPPELVEHLREWAERFSAAAPPIRRTEEGCLPSTHSTRR